MARSAKTKKRANAAPAVELTVQQRMAAMYASKLTKVEDGLLLVSNSIVEPERVSSGVLQIDWMFGGGFVPGMSSIAGQEQTGKTTAVYHTLANSISHLKLPFNGLYDAEGAVSPKYTGKIWEPFGLDVKSLLSKAGREQGFYYYRDQVIETMFDYLKQAMSLMPNKNWSTQANSWAYYFPKRDDHFKRLMDVMGVKASRALSTGPFYVCPTENSGPEGLFCVDSFASLLTREEEEKDESGKTRSAMEASEFSKQLKRVKVDLADKKIIMLGTNQLRSHVRAVYGSPDDQEYESGGNALRFYSEARCRAYSRSSSAIGKFGPFTWDKDNSKFGIEDSVEFPGGTDRYAIKEFKNTKNKFGKPGLKIYQRVWVSDARGNPRGIDPAFDVYMHLLNTRQIKKEGSKGFRFRLHPSVGKRRAELLNSLAPIKFHQLKALVVAEYTDNELLLRRALKAMGLTVKVGLRTALFAQLKAGDDELYSNIKEANLTESNEMEDSDDDAGVDYEEA